MRKIFLVLIFLVTFIMGGTSVSYASDVRVGLVTFYNETHSVDINNRTVNIGYYDGSFSKLIGIESNERRFLVSAYVGELYVSENSVDANGDKYMKLVKDGKIYYCSYTEPTEGDITFSRVQRDEMLKIEYDGKEIFVDNSNKRAVFATDDVVGSTPIIHVGRRGYRGVIEVDVSNGKVTPINIVDMEKYLYSVVCSEMVPSWHIEALKTQTLAARTFAKYYTSVDVKYRNKEYDLTDTVDSQVYKGFDNEKERVRKAVDATAGEMIYYNNKIIPAYFFSTSGGKTENSENVWYSPQPYLKAVPDVETKPEKNPWVVKLTKGDIAKKLKRRGVDIGEIQSVHIEGRTPSGRVMNLRIVGTTGEKVLKKEKMRYALGLLSRRFKVLNPSQQSDKSVSLISSNNRKTLRQLNELYVLTRGNKKTVMPKYKQIIMVMKDNMDNKPLVDGDDEVFTFVGMGYGHGVGMSQSGARYLAEKGKTYREILKHYYTGVEIK